MGDLARRRKRPRPVDLAQPPRSARRRRGRRRLHDVSENRDVDRQTRAAQEPTTSRAFVSASPDGGLVELLARVEASADPLGGIGSLTFPEALSKVPEPPIVQFGPPFLGCRARARGGRLRRSSPMPISEEPPEVVEVAAGPLAIAPIADQRPAGAFTVEVGRFDGAHGAVAAGELRAGLRADGKPAFVTVELVKGVPRYLVGVGGYPDEAAAGAASAEARGDPIRPPRERSFRSADPTRRKSEARRGSAIRAPDSGLVRRSRWIAGRLVGRGGAAGRRGLRRPGPRDWRDEGVSRGFGTGELVGAGVAQELVDTWCQFHPVVSRGRILRICDPEYPDRLASVDDPPPVLFVEGDLSLLAEDAVAVVGTRACTSLGELGARRIARGIAGAGISVVSGLARGIDSAAARGGRWSRARRSPCSDMASRTLLRRRTGPCERRSSVGEGPSSPRSWTRSPRAMDVSRAKPVDRGPVARRVIVEAPVDSGALLTAEAIKQFNRPLFVVPGPGGAPSWKGGHTWVKEGHAQLVGPRRRGGPAPPARRSDPRGRRLVGPSSLRGRRSTTWRGSRQQHARPSARAPDARASGGGGTAPGQRYAPGGDPT